MTISVRGTAIGYINNAASASISFPAGTVAGDLCALFVEHQNPITGPFGWRVVNSLSGTNVSGATFLRVLTADDIARGSVGVGFFSATLGPLAGYGVLAVVSFVGAEAGYRTVVAARHSSGAASRSLTTDATPISGDYAVYFSAGIFTGTGTVTSSAGSSLRSSSNATASGVLAGALLGGAGAVSDTFSYTTGRLADYEIIVIVAETPKAGLNLRVPLVLIESVDTAVANVRAPFLLVEDLSDSFRNLRCAFVLVESLHPVDPEGHVSTQLYPGSLGSSTALPGLQFTFHKRPTFATQVYKGSSGTSVRRAQMQYPIWEFELNYEFLRSNVNNEYQTLLGFYLARQGAFDTFLFKDPDDYLVTAGSLGTGDGVTTQFFFKRTMGGFAEKVGQVDNGATIHIYKNGVLQGSGYTVTLPNSVVFTTAPAAGVAITADFQFFFNCRFQGDSADFSKFADKFWELQQVVLETVPQ